MLLERHTWNVLSIIIARAAKSLSRLLRLVSSLVAMHSRAIQYLIMYYISTWGEAAFCVVRTSPTGQRVVVCSSNYRQQFVLPFAIQFADHDYPIHLSTARICSEYLRNVCGNHFEGFANNHQINLDRVYGNYGFWGFLIYWGRGI